MGPFHEQLEAWLEQEAHLPRKQRHTAQRLYECLQVEGYIRWYSVEETKRVSQLCLMRIDRNRYSVPAEWANTVDSVRLTADRVRIVAEGQIIAEHPRHFGRDQLICDPWHYLPVLEKKPGALRQGAPFQSWDLPLSIKVVRDRILKQDKGDLAFVDLLLMAQRRDTGGSV